MTEFLCVRKFRIKRFICISCIIFLCKSNAAKKFLFRLIDLKLIFCDVALVPSILDGFEYAKWLLGVVLYLAVI